MNATVTDPVTLVYHELRSPLALVATMARDAAEECDNDVLRARCLSIVRATERMLKTATELIIVAERANAEEETAFSPVDVVQRVAADYRSLGVDISTGEMPRQVACTFGKDSALDALLSSLIGNALDHGPERGPVSVSVSLESSRCLINIENQVGNGTKHRGVGLGTYIAEKLARELGATLTSERTETTYRATLQLRVVAIAPAEVA